jgi:hypothetical protein
MSMADVPRIVNDQISRAELALLAKERFGDMVKAVIDVRRAIMSVGGELHADEEQLLIDDGSQQEDLWGINLYPEVEGSDWIEFDSMINIRPSQGNRSRDVENEAIRNEISRIVSQIVSG